MKNKNKKNKNKSKCLAVIKIRNQEYSIRATDHALIRMEERKIDGYVVSGNVLALGEEKILRLQKEQEDVIIIDKDKNVSIVIGFRGNKICIITVIDSGNVWVKENTTIQNI